MTAAYKYGYTFLFSGLIVLLFSACGGDKTNTDRLLPEVESVEVSATALEIISTETIQFTAVASYSDHSTRNVTSSVTWTVSDITMAFINVNGLLTPRGSGGELNVTSGYAGYYEKTTVNIVPLISIDVIAADENMTVNSTYQLEAIGYFGTEEENSSSDITERVTWTTSDQAIAVVDANGLLYTYTAGSVDVNATLFDVNGSLELNITE
ncbi:MAG: hypothetical protein DRG24_07255 [Epsilonproteobacteria bacterium]|nr:MAG: hypothetical protein DRG24_07255 [Campylobacterota bacterium]